MKNNVAFLLVTLLSGGCSSIIEGTHQEIMVNTNPSGAACAFYREGGKIGELATSPGAVLVKKTKRDITILCAKDGYQQATYLNHSGTAGATLGNIILGGGIGWAIDSAAGADNKYDSPVNVSLVPVRAPAPDPAPPAVPPAAPPAAPAAPQWPATLPGTAPTS
jgi:hypothetical protein